ncbi:MAG: hypothetical protein ABIR32_21230 [Ilumatobacteraceae bacterium]
MSDAPGAVDRLELVLDRRTRPERSGGAADVVDHLGVADDEWLPGREGGSIGAVKCESVNDVGIAGDPPAAFVHQSMVEPAEADEVAGFGGTLVGPVDDVVGVDPAHPVASRRHASTVSQEQRPAQLRRWESMIGADSGLGRPVDLVTLQHRIAQHPPRPVA